MIKYGLILLSFTLCAASAAAAQLTAQEVRWLSAGAAVLNHAKQQLHLPIDITVQPQARPQDVPLALGYQDGRCKLVLSLRGNPHGEEVLAGVPAEQQAWMIEAMVAHEIGHCWRYAQGVWHRLPAGFEETQVASQLALQENRREEGYADLVALAWIAQTRPQHYGAVLDWMQQVRSVASGSGSHSTLAWLQQAPAAAAFVPDTPWPQQVDGLWQQGLQQQP